jgi:hypothetical protein
MGNCSLQVIQRDGGTDSLSLWERGSGRVSNEVVNYNHIPLVALACANLANPVWTPLSAGKQRAFNPKPELRG